MSEAVHITLALSKGKLFAPAVALLQRAGLIADAELFRSRRLRFASDTHPAFHFLLVKNSDVPTYVEYGIADAGIAGLDVLLESGAEVDAPLNLQIGRCRIAVAGRPEDAGRGYILQSQLRVATKYPRLTREYFAGRGAQVEIIKLDGSVELAVLVGLADRIVDLVETGETLRQNDLLIHEVIGESTARLIVNKASHKLKLAAITDLINRLRKAVHENSSR
ncbi:MAG: ATP phosphoribosyltransferase [candidate division KSB1 bacterium]|nr:ATP phosphoribosyltransferase [candidate division KSB1 bacterium]MDZ7274404.1 ATP phosphoribosyltransferase [candidate division KSB1 bacterium]MDZ7284934.1 ATP phosphoribosyltransferase [candidate division KSB1 bacterium]MDZ7297645.1 ATP phosphoribosyltransferase [candidate division KSB1 bacterium]MDZ7348512.1 ATP phosphoribosyltransferase [candidate division KSB1 bacterium]